MVDTVEGREKGDFLLDCIWRVLGQVPACRAELGAGREVDGNELHLEQDGERFHIVNADGSEKSLTDREADFAPDWKSNWENYEHADGVVRMWHQKKRVALDAGDRTAYVNLLYPSNAGMDQAFALERVGPSVVLVRDLSACLRAARRQACVSHAQADQQTDQGVMAGVGPFRSGALEVEGKLFRIDRNGFALVERHRAVVGGAAVPELGAGLGRDGSGEGRGRYRGAKRDPRGHPCGGGQSERGTDFRWRRGKAAVVHAFGRPARSGGLTRGRRGL